MEALPLDLKCNIFSRLPVDTISECKRFCKPWRNLISQSSFARLHYLNAAATAAASGRVGMVFLSSDMLDRKLLYYGEFDARSQKTYLSLTRIKHPFIDEGIGFISSCNGLISFFEYIGGGIQIDDPVYVFNPITFEFVNLPRFTIDDGSLSYWMHCGFGCDFYMKEYKVVRIYYLSDQPSVGRVQVYTLGGSGWRDIGGIEIQMEENTDTYKNSSGILVRGALHWVVKKYKILSFDLAREEFCVLPAPPCFSLDVGNYYALKELEGSLCVVHNRVGEFVDIWSWEKMKMSGSWNWSKKISITLENDDDGYYEPITIMKVGIVLLWYNEVIFCSYEPGTKALKAIGNYKKGLGDFLIITHRNSFVSLKSLGEAANIIGSAEGVQPCILL